MRVAGWILILLGALGTIGYLAIGQNPSGILLLVALGVYLIRRKNQKEKEEKDKEKWNAGNK